MSEPSAATTSEAVRHTYAEMAELYPHQWVAFLAHGPQRYQVIASGADLTALMGRIADGEHASRASFAHLKPRQRAVAEDPGVGI